MAKKKVELFQVITTEKDFENALNLNVDKLICAEIYCAFVGSCVALDKFFTTVKFEWSKDNVVLLKVLADEIEVLSRFRKQSQPIYMFIVNKKTTKVFRGVDTVKLREVVKKELHQLNQELGGYSGLRPTYELEEATPDEMESINARMAEKQQEVMSLMSRRAERQAARKWHRAELMVPHLQQFNFVLYWPHAKHAHPELYERWDDNNIIMVGREEVELTEDKALDVLYAGDAPLNEASLHMLLYGKALAIAFRLLDDDIHFVSLVRKILYEEIQPVDGAKPRRDQAIQKTAFENYISYSPTKEEIWQKRRENKAKRREEAKEQRARHLSEIQRLARQAIVEAMEAKKKAKEDMKIQLLKAGNLVALNELSAQSDEYDLGVNIPAELSDELEEESSEEEVQNEYFPPAGLVVPGLYAPPNDIAKVNGLAVLFPKLTLEHVTPQAEFLPPHVLVMLSMNKRHKAIEAMSNHTSDIVHMGVFKASTPFDAVHVAYTVKQFESLHSSMTIDDLRLAFMVSMNKDRALLELMDLAPLYVSRDETAGEDECAAMFSVDYGDEYPVFEDFVGRNKQ